MNHGKYVYRDMTMTTDTGGTGSLDTVGDVAQAAVDDLENVTVLLNQLTDNGTTTLIVDVSYDGTNFVPAAATKADTDFAAGANQSLVAYTLSDANGMPLQAKTVRIRNTVHTGTGTYTAGIAGMQKAIYR